MIQLQVKDYNFTEDDAGEIILGASSDSSYIELKQQEMLLEKDIISIDSSLYRVSLKNNILRRINDITFDDNQNNIKVALIPRFAVIVMSDSCFRGTSTDKTGLFISSHLEECGFYPDSVEIIPDERKELLKLYKDLLKENINLIITTGGTGLYKRDITPDTTRQIVEKEIRGIPQAIIAHGLEKTPLAMLGRIYAGSIGRTLIINLPGSLKAVSEAFEVISPLKNKVLIHAVEKLAGSKRKCGE